MISDQFQEAMGVTINTTYAGEPTHRYSNCESYQHTKSLSYGTVSLQISLKVKNKAEEDKSKLAKIHDLNESAMIKLIILLTHQMLENLLNGVSHDIL